MKKLSIWKKYSIVLTLIYTILGVTIITASYTVEENNIEIQNTIDIFRKVFIGIMPIVVVTNIFLSNKSKKIFVKL